MPQFSFLAVGHFGEGEACFRHKKHRVVAEAALASRRLEDLTGADSFHFQHHFASGVRQSQSGGEAGASLHQPSQPRCTGALLMSSSPQVY
jgi:hypothetical protein